MTKVYNKAIGKHANDASSINACVYCAKFDETSIAWSWITLNQWLKKLVDNWKIYLRPLYSCWLRTSYLRPGVAETNRLTLHLIYYFRLMTLARNALPDHAYSMFTRVIICLKLSFQTIQ